MTEPCEPIVHRTVFCQKQGAEKEEGEVSKKADLKRVPRGFELFRGVARGGPGSRAPPEFGRSVKPIQTRGQIMPLTLLPAPPIQKAIYTSV